MSSSGIFPSRSQPLGDIELGRHKDTSGTIPNGPEFGADGRDIWLRYRFPTSDLYPKGFEYVMYARIVGGELRTEIQGDRSVAHVVATKPVLLLTAVVTSRDAADPFERAKAEVAQAQRAGLRQLTREHRDYWHDYWQRSFVQISNSYLNQHWFVCYYHLACCARSGKIMPPLFGNWSWEDSPAVWRLLLEYLPKTCSMALTPAIVSNKPSLQ